MGECVILVILNSTNPLTCFQCGSQLILVSSVVEQVPNSRFFQTNSVYRCSNQVCQDEKDREGVKRRQLFEEKKLATQKRLEEKLRKKKVLV